VRIWAFDAQAQGWVEEDVLAGHTDWVRDVAWAPAGGLPRSYLASAGQDRVVLVWTRDVGEGGWKKTALQPEGGAGVFPDVVWRVSWSSAGNVLAVSCGDGKVSLWKESVRGAWECVSEMSS
jgi:protein transport protein SEC13